MRRKPLINIQNDINKILEIEKEIERIKQELIKPLKKELSEKKKNIAERQGISVTSLNNAIKSFKKFLNRSEEQMSVEKEIFQAIYKNPEVIDTYRQTLELRGKKISNKSYEDEIYREKKAQEDNFTTEEYQAIEPLDKDVEEHYELMNEAAERKFKDNKLAKKLYTKMYECVNESLVHIVSKFDETRDYHKFQGNFRSYFDLRFEEFMFELDLKDVEERKIYRELEVKFIEFLYASFRTEINVDFEKRYREKMGKSPYRKFPSRDKDFFDLDGETRFPGFLDKCLFALNEKVCDDDLFFSDFYNEIPKKKLEGEEKEKYKKCFEREKLEKVIKLGASSKFLKENFNFEILDLIPYYDDDSRRVEKLAIEFGYDKKRE